MITEKYVYITNMAEASFQPWKKDIIIKENSE